MWTCSLSPSHSCEGSLQARDLRLHELLDKFLCGCRWELVPVRPRERGGNETEEQMEGRRVEVLSSLKTEGAVWIGPGTRRQDAGVCFADDMFPSVVGEKAIGVRRSRACGVKCQVDCLHGNDITQDDRRRWATGEGSETVPGPPWMSENSTRGRE